MHLNTMACCGGYMWLAAKNGHLDCLRNLYNRDKVWFSNDVCTFAAENGHIDCLRFARDHGAPWNMQVCALAAYNGHLDTLRWAHEHGAPWSGLTCLWAAEFGHWDCLIYAHEQGAPWHLWTCSSAAQNNQTACLRYAFLCGAPWPKAPAEMVAWRDRVRGTAAYIMHIVRNNRAHCAATIIQRAWLKRHYAPDGRGKELTMAHFNQLALAQYRI